MGWKLTTLIENHKDKQEKYECEHGFSILIENTEQRQSVRLLMDTGQSGLFYDNAVKMGISLENLDGLFISHAHYDHAGGVKRLLEEVPVEKMYIGKDFFQEKYYKKKDGTLKNIGIAFSRQDMEHTGVEVCEIQENRKKVFPGVTVYRNFDSVADYEVLNPHFLVKDFVKGEEKYEQDNFTDEMILTLDVGDGIIVIVGCSHPGIVNILKTIEKRSGKRIRGIVGGTHLVEADEERLKKTIADLKKMNLDFIAVSHCTGEENLEKIKEVFGEKFIFNCTGNIIKIS